MERDKVDSRSISSVGYDPDSMALEIEFNSGGLYQYHGVPQTEYDALMRADSKGAYFTAYIRERYSTTKVY